jgi:hypothetical protein
MAIHDEILNDLPFLTALRRDLHAHPELGFEEERTSDIVAKLLGEASLEVHRGLGGTGVVGTLKFGDGPRTIGLRADMDALAMPETADRPHRSTAPGKMHARGRHFFFIRCGFAAVSQQTRSVTVPRHRRRSISSLFPSRLQTPWAARIANAVAAKTFAPRRISASSVSSATS